MKTTILALVSALTLIGTSSPARADRLVIKGSDTLGAKLVPQLAEQFKAAHADATSTLPPKDRRPDSPR